jgi:hypothetical protein
MKSIISAAFCFCLLLSPLSVCGSGKSGIVTNNHDAAFSFLMSMYVQRQSYIIQAEFLQKMNAAASLPTQEARSAAENSAVAERDARLSALNNQNASLSKAYSTHLSPDSSK